MAFIRAYLRASTGYQNDSRARQALNNFTNEKGAPVASW